MGALHALKWNQMTQNLPRPSPKLMPSDILPPTTHSSSAPLRPVLPGAAASPAALSPYCLRSAEAWQLHEHAGMKKSLDDSQNTMCCPSAMHAGMNSLRNSCAALSAVHAG